jgi:hypothetical protein
MPIIIEGLEELSNMLQNLTPQAAKRYLSRVAEPAAQVVLDAMAETVPVRVGMLEEELGWRKTWANDGDETTMIIDIGPLKPAFWGSLQEFGAKARNQPAQHWMGRAWESCREACLAVFEREAFLLLYDLDARKTG